jgi:hypothetical protein
MTEKATSLPPTNCQTYFALRRMGLVYSDFTQADCNDLRQERTVSSETGEMRVRNQTALGACPLVELFQSQTGEEFHYAS